MAAKAQKTKRSQESPSACPSCASPKIAPILYGYPADVDGYLKATHEGVIIGGGCVIEPDAAAWGCKACGHRWGRLSRR